MSNQVSNQEARADLHSWQIGKEHALAGKPWYCPLGVNQLPYAAGRFDGEAQKQREQQDSETRAVRVQSGD
jgi:hypothetical protein